MNPVCPICGDPVQPDWTTCPMCRGELSPAAGTPQATVSPFVAPESGPPGSGPPRTVTSWIASVVIAAAKIAGVGILVLIGLLGLLLATCLGLWALAGP